MVATPPMSATGSSPRSFAVLFGHQSVGADIIRGMSELSDMERATGPRICDRHHIDTGGGATDAPWLLIHAPIGRNCEPLSKLDDFERLVLDEFCASVDVALLKFCYVDVTSATLVPALLETYICRMAALADAVPHVRIAHITVPLRRVQPAWRAALSRSLGRSLGRGLSRALGRGLGLGREDPEVEHNRAREDFNRRLRETVPPTSLFDLAAIESESAENSGYSARPRSLRADWTNDGGHLNARGRKIAARAFLQFLEFQRSSVCPQR